MDLIKVKIVPMETDSNPQNNSIYELVQQQTIILQTLTEKINHLEQSIYKMVGSSHRTGTLPESKVKLKVTVKPKTKNLVSETANKLSESRDPVSENANKLSETIKPKPKLFISNLCLKPKLPLKIIESVSKTIETPLPVENVTLSLVTDNLSREQELELIVQEKSERIKKERQKKHIRERLQPRPEKELPEEPVLDDQEREEKLKKISSKAPWANLAKKSKEMIHIEKQIYLDKLQEEQLVETRDPVSETSADNI